MKDIDRTLKRHLLWYCSSIVLSSLLFAHPLTALVRMAISTDDASYILLIPCISTWILFIERHEVFQNLSSDLALGCGLLIGATSMGLAATLAGGVLAPSLRLSVYILSLVLFWVSGFALLFGKTASQVGFFPLIFLFLMVPIPNFLLGHIIYLLQVGSTWITGVFFNLLGVPSLRDGLVFQLAGVNIEIAKECSGIRSSMALVILALVVAHFRLKSFWRQSLFVACGLFMMILKNGIRIATLALLGLYVDPGFLYGRLHHEGGIVFFLLGLLLLWPILWSLQRGEVASSEVSKPVRALQGSGL